MTHVLGMTQEITLSRSFFGLATEAKATSGHEGAHGASQCCILGQPFPGWAPISGTPKIELCVFSWL